MCHEGYNDIFEHWNVSHDRTHSVIVRLDPVMIYSTNFTSLSTFLVSDIEQVPHKLNGKGEQSRGTKIPATTFKEKGE